MKKLYFSALSILFGLGINAQTTLTQANHAPAAGDMYGTYQCDSTGVTPGASGAGASWTYSSIVTHSPIVLDYVGSAYSGTAFPSAAVSVTSSASNTRYYSSTATELKYWGGAMSLNGIPASVTFTQAALYAAYPMSLGTSTAGAIGGSLTVFGNNGTFNGACNSNADGTGTLTLPAKTFSSAVRVVTSVTINFTNPGPPAISGTITQVTWDYYSLSHSKYPMFTITTSTVNAPPLVSNSTQSFVTIQKNYTSVGMNDLNSEEASLNVYPNPATSQVNFITENTHAKSVTVYDITGKMIETISISNGKANLNVSGYNNGLYIYKLTDNNNKTIKTGKITVAH